MPSLLTRRRPLLLALAVLAAGAYFAALAVGATGSRILTKPVPVLSLAAWAWCAERDRYARRLSVGLLLSAAADLLIEWRFLAGLLVFLAAHLAYIAAFWTEARGLRALRALPFAAWGVLIVLLLSPGLGPLAAPVVVYTAAICTMLWRAAARVGSSGRGGRSEWAALAGALAFSASDTLIALDRFHAPIPGARVPIMLLYWAGQLGLALSAERAAPAGRG